MFRDDALLTMRACTRSVRCRPAPGSRSARPRADRRHNGTHRRSTSEGLESQAPAHNRMPFASGRNPDQSRLCPIQRRLSYSSSWHWQHRRCSQRPATCPSRQACVRRTTQHHRPFPGYSPCRRKPGISSRKNNPKLPPPPDLEAVSVAGTTFGSVTFNVATPPGSEITPFLRPSPSFTPPSSINICTQ